MSLPKLYLETTIPSYLTARRSRDLRLAADQETTQEWWEFHRHQYELFVSAIVLDECAAGDAAMAAARHGCIAGVSQLAQTAEVDALAALILHEGIIPANAAPDANHIALATVHGMNFLLTWNCTHIANAFNRRRLEAVCVSLGWVCPVICTPAVLIGF